MTPKEKCDELIDKFIPNMYCYMGSGMLSNDYDEKVALNNAKQCALIAVDELIKYSPNKPIDEYDPIQYFKEVKQEIKKL